MRGSVLRFQNEELSSDIRNLWLIKLQITSDMHRHSSIFPELSEPAQ